MQVGLRKVLMLSLVASFVGQSAMVYFDDTATPAMSLSEDGVAGRKLWHELNCQTCHQIYGFGGFLGPDLTNAAPRLTRARLDEVLTVGNAQMPAYHLNGDQIYLIESFLHEVNKTGIGVARASVPLPPAEVYAAIDAQAAATAPSPAAQKGYTTFRANCAVCHTPLQSTPLGVNTAPDLSTVTTRLDDDTIRRTIRDGRPAKGMLAWPSLGEQGIGEVLAWFHWLHDQRAAIKARTKADDAQHGLPWWEYR